MVDPLPPGATATVPLRAERSLAVESNSTLNEEGARIASIEGGRLEINRDWVTHTKYTVKNGGDTDAKALIKHARQWGTRLHNPPKGPRTTPGRAARSCRWTSASAGARCSTWTSARRRAGRSTGSTRSPTTR